MTQARVNRDDLRGLYGTVKDCDAHVELTFITGVSKFSKVSLFSDLNFLTDLTLNPCYAAVCGYTESDLDTVFAPELPGLDRGQIRAWYNGYNWRGKESVYNPYAILHLFASREFEAHWSRPQRRGFCSTHCSDAASRPRTSRTSMPAPPCSRPST